MGLLGQVLTGVVASRMGRGGLGGGLGGGLPGALGGAVLGGMGRGRGGSPVLKGLALLLAAKAAHGYIQRRQQENAGQAAGGGQTTGGSLGSPAQGSGGLGGLLGGVAGGGGLGALVEQFTRNGHGDAINSWIGKGPNQKLPPQQLAEALGPDTVQALKAETGLPEDELLEELSDALPEAVDQLSPDGDAPDPSLLSGDDLDLDEFHPTEVGTGPRTAM
jgi:uncharacterized protein YidB (DUF937 family)